MLWATAIEIAFSQDEVCLLYNPFGKQLMFFVLNPELQDQVICRDGNRSITFGEVDGKVLNLDVTSLPRLRFVLQHAKHAVVRARSQIEQGLSKPRHWDTVTTLQSMMQDDTIRLLHDPDVARKKTDSPDVFATCLSLCETAYRLEEIRRQGFDVYAQQPHLRSVDEDMYYYRVSQNN
jgi:hypothetical protein